MKKIFFLSLLFSFGFSFGAEGDLISECQPETSLIVNKISASIDASRDACFLDCNYTVFDKQNKKIFSYDRQQSFEKTKDSPLFFKALFSYLFREKCIKIPFEHEVLSGNPLSREAILELDKILFSRFSSYLNTVKNGGGTTTPQQSSAICEGELRLSFKELEVDGEKSNMRFRACTVGVENSKVITIQDCKFLTMLKNLVGKKNLFNLPYFKFSDYTRNGGKLGENQNNELTRICEEKFLMHNNLFKSSMDQYKFVKCKDFQSIGLNCVKTLNPIEVAKLFFPSQ